MAENKTPAEFVIEAFGGVRALARALGKSPSTVSRWRSTKGLIPSSVQAEIIRLAREKGLAVTHQNLIEGE